MLASVTQGQATIAWGIAGNSSVGLAQINLSLKKQAHSCVVT